MPGAILKNRSVGSFLFLPEISLQGKHTKEQMTEVLQTDAALLLPSKANNLFILFLGTFKIRVFDAYMYIYMPILHNQQKSVGTE